MASTKEKITATALALFAQRGYDGVSVRDICKQVGIKESSLYYHFPSKQAILTTLLSHFENRAAEGMAQLEQALGDQQGPWGQVSYRMVCQAFFEGYLMDPFCNQVLRLLQMDFLPARQHHSISLCTHRLHRRRNAVVFLFSAGKHAQYVQKLLRILNFFPRIFTEHFVIIAFFDV